MYYEIVEAKYLNDFLIAVKFLDGKSGIVNLEFFKNKVGIYSRFNDSEFFKNLKINKDFGVLTWNDEIDIAPETIYSLATGKSLPDWMQNDIDFAAA